MPDFAKIFTRIRALLQEKQVTATKKNKPNTPWLQARKTWNDHVGSILAQRDIWRLTCLLALLISLGSVGGLIHFASRSKLVPYVIEVDRFGHTLVVGEALQTTAMDQRIVRAVVADFVFQSRLVTPDVALQRKAIFRVYAYIDPQGAAFVKMNTWFGNAISNPFSRAQKEMVSIQIRSVLPLSTTSWQVDWEETRYDRNGSLIEKPFTMRALITLRQYTQTQEVSEETLRNNPMGIFIHDFSWAKII